MSKTFIMNILYSTHELRLIGLQCKLNSTTFENVLCQKIFVNGREGKKVV